MFYGVAGSCIQTVVKRVKNGKKVKIWSLPVHSSALGVIEPMPCQPTKYALPSSNCFTAAPWVFKAITCAQAHASSAYKARVALAVIASPAVPWVFKAVTCARA